MVSFESFVLFALLSSAGLSTALDILPAKNVAVGKRYLLAGSGAGISDQSVEPLADSVSHKRPLVIADGGFSYVYPQMTMPAFKAAAEAGADYVLCGLVVTADNKALCRPTLDLAQSTDIGIRWKNETGSKRSSMFTLKKLKELKAKQVVKFRPDAFDGRFGLVTPHEVADALMGHWKGKPRTRRTRLAMELLEPDQDPMASIPPPGRMSTSEVLIKFLRARKWTEERAPVLVLVQTLESLQGLRKQGIRVKAVLKYTTNALNLHLPNSQNASSGVDDTFQKWLRSVAEVADGMALPRLSLLKDCNQSANGVNQSTNGIQAKRLCWKVEVLDAIKRAELGTFIYDLHNDNMGAPLSIEANTFRRDPLSMYVDLFHDKAVNLIDGVITSSPSTAAAAGVCYGGPGQQDNLAIQKPGKDRPILISSGGSQAVFPSQTAQSYLQAIAEGADFIDCNVQVSKDDVLFCHSEARLKRKTDVDLHREFYLNEYDIGDLRTSESQNYYSFDYDWKQLETLKVKHVDGEGDRDFSGIYRMITFQEFLDIAIKSQRKVGVFVKVDNPTFLSMKPTPHHHVVPAILKSLSLLGILSNDLRYNESTAKVPLIIASFDRCGLGNISERSGGTIPTVQKITGGQWKEYCDYFTDIKRPTEWWTSKGGLAHIRTYAMGISPAKNLILEAKPVPSTKSGSRNGETGMGFLNRKPSSLVSDAHRMGLKVIVKAFQNDILPGDENDKNGGAYDYLMDPALELELFCDQLGIDGFEELHVATAAMFFRSSCRNRKKNPKALQWPWTVTLGQFIGQVYGDSGFPTKEITIIAMAATLVVLLLIAGGLYCYCWSKKKRSQQQWNAVPDLQRTASINQRLRQIQCFQWSELAESTNNFCSNNIIGKGAFGTVYKGILKDQKEIAVKKHSNEDIPMKTRSEAAIVQLKNEMQIIGTLHSKHVVTLQGYSLDREWILVYELMPNGSLEDALWKPRYPHKLCWEQWKNIVIGVATGVMYLHEICEPRVVHRDIKPGNVLLDASFNPKLADFGLARRLAGSDESVNTRVMGTCGYVAPEYGASGHLNEKSDVYSFGVLLITIITRQRALYTNPENPAERIVSLDVVRRKALGGPEALLSVVSPEFDDIDMEEAMRWLYTALSCTQPDPERRPSMGVVVQILQRNHSWSWDEICVTPPQFILPPSSLDSSTESFHISKGL